MTHIKTTSDLLKECEELEQKILDFEKDMLSLIKQGKNLLKQYETHINRGVKQDD